MLYIRTRTDASLLDSLITVKEYVDFCLELDYKAVAICDLNVTYNHLEFYNYCKKLAIKPILGVELEYTLDNNAYSVLLYAKNKDGLENLNYLSTITLSNEVLSFEKIKAHAKNCYMILHANSHINHKQQNEEELFTLKLELDILYGVDKIDAEVETFARTFKIYLIQVNLVKYLYAYQAKDYTMQQAIRTDVRYIFDDTKYNFALTDVKVLESKYLIDLDKFIASINIELVAKLSIPVFDTNKDSKEYLKALCYKGLEKRFSNQEYAYRLDYELDIINQMGFNDYFLIVYDYVKYAKKNRILVGAGRGSAAGSLVAYCLGITNIDPMHYQLLFERFLNIDRKSLPDIDIDFADNRRDEVVNYLVEKYGRNHVAGILTFNTFGSRQVIRDVAKALDVNQTNINFITQAINPFLSLKDNYKTINKFVTRLYDVNHDIYKYSLNLEGLKRHTSIHAAGIVISNQSLDRIVGLKSVVDLNVTQTTMENLAVVGLLKFDLLSLRNLTNIANICYNLGDFEIDKIDINDSKVFQLFASAATLGIFQFESEGMKSLLMRLKPESIIDLATANALHRPGPMENIDTYLTNRFGDVIYLHDSLEDILEETFGIIVYQEQIMLIVQKMAGFSLAKADVFRVAMSKKNQELIDSMQDDFVNSSISNGYSKEDSEVVFNNIAKFAGYGFNKAHAVSYAYIAYQMAYLKTYFPLDFYVEMINSNAKSKNKLNTFIQEGRKLKYKFVAVDIRYSQFLTSKLNNTVLLGFNIVARFDENSYLILKQYRHLLNDLALFLTTLVNEGFNKQLLISLIKIGAFDYTTNKTKKSLVKFVENVEYNDLDRFINTTNSFDFEELDEYTSNELITFEKEGIGFYFKAHPTINYITAKHVTVDTINNYLHRKVNMVLYVNGFRNTTTKKGDKMAFVTLSDYSGEIDGVVFPTAYKLELEVGMLLEVFAEVEIRNESTQLIIASYKYLTDRLK